MRSKLFLMAFALVALVIAGCSKEKESESNGLATKILGDWHYASEEYDVDVYVTFNANGAFEEYQRLGEGRYRLYTGTWTMKDSELNGMYSDGESWGSGYKVSFTGDTMTLTATNKSAEALTYIKESVPEEVKQTAIEPFDLRSVDMRWF